MSPKMNRRMFVTAALFNCIVGTVMIIDAGLLLGAFKVTPLPTEPLYVYLSGWAVITFGIGYYWASRDLAANAPVVRLGIIGKLGVVVVALTATLMGLVSWQLNILTSADLIFAVLFILALQSAD